MKKIILLLFIISNLTLAQLFDEQRYFEEISPGYGIDYILKLRLANLAFDIETKNWTRALTNFDPDYTRAQLDMYFNDKTMFDYLGEVGKRDTIEVVKLFLSETLGISDIKELNEIKKMAFVDFSYEGGESDYLIVYYYFELNSGKIIEGNCGLNLTTNLLYGAWG